MYGIDSGARVIKLRQVKVSVLTKCNSMSLYKEVQSEPILFDNVLWERVEPFHAHKKTQKISLEAEMVVSLCIKVGFTSATIEDKISVR